MMKANKICEFEFDAKQTAIQHEVFVCINQKKASFKLAIDTGCYDVILNIDLINIILDIDLGEKPKSRMITGATEPEIAYNIILDSIKLENIERKNFPALCKKFPKKISVDGILGRKFFEDLRLIFDFKKKNIEIERY